MTRFHWLLLGIFLLAVFVGACAKPAAKSVTGNSAPPASAVRNAPNTASVATPTTRAPNRISPSAGPKSAPSSPTVLKNAKRIPETHVGRTQCLTCHEFGTVGPPMPQFHRDAKYDNSMCKRCHLGP